MSALVQKITYSEAITAIREILLDVNPAQCFEVSGQDFPFVKTDTTVTIDTLNYDIDTQVQKLYTLLQKLVEKGVSVKLLPEYSALEYTSGLVNFNFPSIENATTILRTHYFSDNVINRTIVEYYSKFMVFDGIPKTTETIFNMLDFFERNRLVYWVAYWLLDLRRSNSAAYGAATGDGSEQLINSQEEVTTTVGDTFRVVEKNVDGGDGTNGFTSLWGDQFDYWTKMQLWIRQRYESLFGDYSLRENVMRNSTFTSVKPWTPYDWAGVASWSERTRGIFLPQEPYSSMP